MTNTNAKTFYTTYSEATKWLKNNYILCNNIVNIDSNIYDNARFNLFDENDNCIEIFQWFLTDASTSDVEYLEKYFNLKFTYSDVLDCYILCVNHFGTSWDYVPCIVNDIDESTPHVKTYEELTGLKD